MKNNNKNKIFFIIHISLLAPALLLATQLLAPIYESNSISDVLQYVNSKQDLVLFDLDNTLIRANKLQANSEWFDWHYAQLRSHGHSQEEILQKLIPLHTKAQLESITLPIEPNTDRIINTLQHKGIHPIALTARSSVDLTKKQLKGTRINFQKNYPRKDICYKFTDLKQPYFYTPGLLFASGNDKGRVLETFIQRHLKYQPKKIILVDDRLDNIEHVEEMAKRLGIPFVGLRYGYVDPEVKFFEKQMQIEHHDKPSKTISGSESVKISK